MRSSPRCPALVVAAVVLSSVTARAQIDATLEFDQRFLGLIDSAFDFDLIEIREPAGSKLTVVLSSDAGNALQPRLELLDASMTPLELGDALEISKKKKVRLEEFALPGSGPYLLRVSSENALTGTYTLKISAQPVKKFSGEATVAAPGEIVEVPFAARAGSSLKGTIERVAGDVVPHGVELIGPGGNLVALAGTLEASADGTSLSLSGVVLPAVGDYRLRVTGASGSIGTFAWSLKVVPPSPVKGKVFEEGHPKDDGTPPDGFVLEDIAFGRGLRTADGLSMDVVSPYSLVKEDPVSGLPVPGSLEPLFPGGSLSTLVSFHLGPVSGPPVVPRNGVLVLRFAKKPDPASLALDAAGRTTAESPIRVTVNGEPVTLEAFVDGKEVILNPAFGDQVGLPAGPLAFDAAGNPTADAAGVAALELVGTGPHALRSVTGSAVSPRADLLGSVDAGGAPIGFNPGNQALDFFDQTDVGPGTKSYGGFLPDETAPRLVRELRLEESYDPDFATPAAGDVLGVDFLGLVRDLPFDVHSKGGNGEWAGGILRLRPGGTDTEEIPITRNTVLPLGDGTFRNDLLLAAKIVVPPAVGEAVELVRAEFFEPDPSHPIDPALFDGDNPELARNADLVNFVEVRDRDGLPIDVSLPIDPLSSFTFQFSEPMRPESFRPYETLFVTDDPAIDDFGLNRLGVVETSAGGRVVTFRPHRRIQFGPLAGTDVPVGFGSASKALRLHLKVVPSADVLVGLLGTAGYEAFEREGHRGITDLGGQSLGFPLSFASPSQPFVDYSLPFVTQADPTLSDVGAVVHRFLGQPTTGADEDGNTGIAFRDVPKSLCGEGNDLYGPRIADLNLFTNGFLSGAPVQFFTKVHDDFHPPLDIDGNATHLNPFPFGTSTPIGGFSVVGGARMQHVYRAEDASPDWRALAGTHLDLIGLAFAPIGGFVTDTVLPDISIHAGHSHVVPDTRQSGGIPSHPDSGLGDAMDANYGAIESDSGVAHDRQLVVGSPNGAGGYEGVPFTIANASTFTPPGTPHAYHPFPTFTTPFAYNNGVLDQATFSAPAYGAPPTTWGGTKGTRRPQSLLLEYRVRAVDPANPPAMQNGFTFAVGVLSSAIPRFRVFTIGTGCLSCCFVGPGGCAGTCLISFGPPMDGQNGNATPLDPDSITHAAGPAPAPPGLPCYCLRPPQNAATPPTGCTDTTTAAPTIDQVAQGLAPNPSAFNQSNNYGDNSRYFMTFDYVKRESRFRSPFVRVRPSTGPDAVSDPRFLAPIFDPPLDAIPAGTTLEVRFRASASGVASGLGATSWVTPEEMAEDDNALNQVGGTPYIQFEVYAAANTSTSLTPVLDEVVVPFRQP